MKDNDYNSSVLTEFLGRLFLLFFFRLFFDLNSTGRVSDVVGILVADLVTFPSSLAKPAKTSGPSCLKQLNLTLLHSGRPKLYAILAFLSAVRLMYSLLKDLSLPEGIYFVHKVVPIQNACV